MLAARSARRGGCPTRGSICKPRPTIWELDAAGRPVREIRADKSNVYTYQATTSRLKTVTDPKQQVTTYTYNRDDTVTSTVYTNTQIPPPSVSPADISQRAWGPTPTRRRSSPALVAPAAGAPAYNRVAMMVDGTGTTTYAYHPAGVLGAGQVASVDGPLPNDTITYVYDELGRVVSRAIDGVAAGQTYDGLGRVTTETNVPPLEHLDVRPPC